MKITFNKIHLDFGIYRKPFTCAHTPKMNKWFPVCFCFINMKQANGMFNCAWSYRLWIYTWFGQWCFDIDKVK